MNEWLTAAPMAMPAHGQTGCMVSLNDFADRAPQMLALMHGPSFTGDGGAALRALAEVYDRRVSDHSLAVLRNAA